MIEQQCINTIFFLDNEFDNCNNIGFTNNNEDKINISYHLLNTENTEKHVKICQGDLLHIIITYLIKFD